MARVQVCRQERRFRFRPQRAAQAHYVRVAVLEAERWSHTHNSRCGGVDIYLTRALPYPEGGLVDSALSPTNGTAACGAEYTLALSNQGCGGYASVGALGERSLQRCTHPVDDTTLYYVTVWAAARNVSSSVSLRVLSASRASESADTLFAPHPADAPTRTAPPTLADESRHNVTQLELGQVAYGRSEAGEDSLFAAEVADERSELLCSAAASTGRLMLFMSTSSRFPSRLQTQHVQVIRCGRCCVPVLCD
jgi:hypothetical protein